MTAPPWQAEREVSPELAAELLAAQFPELAGAVVVPLAAGYDNTVHLVADRWVFRFPRRTVALDGVRREIAVLPGLAPRLPLPIPVPELIGRPGRGFPWPFYGCRFLPGTELAASGLDDEDRGPAAAAVGSFLRTLHEPEILAAFGAGLPVDPFARADPAARLRVSMPWLERLEAAGHWHRDDAWEALRAAADRLPSPGRAPVLCHGDLHLRHLLVDGGGAASGVIDWGDLCLAHPAVDLSLAFAAFTGGAQAAMLEAYGGIDTDTEVRARVLALSLCAALANHATATDQPVLLAEALAGCRRALT